MHDLSHTIAKVTAECDAAIRAMKEANAGYNKDKPPVEYSKLGSQTLITSNMSTMDYVMWNKDSLVAFTRAREHLEEAIEELEGWRKIFKAVLTADTDPEFLNGRHGPNSDKK